MDTRVIDQAKLEAFAARAIGDLTTAYTGVTVRPRPTFGRNPCPCRKYLNEPLPERRRPRQCRVGGPC
jgi:hypothetical protein